MTAQATETVVSRLLSQPIVPKPVSGLLLRGLDLAPRTKAPAWVSDPDMRASIEAGFIDIPDDLHGGA
jgi:hypothetical protein